MNTPRLFRPLALAAALVVPLAACDDDDDPSGPEGSFTLSANPTTVTIAPGATQDVALTVTRAGGFTGAITVTATGLPTGVTADPVTIAGSATTGTMTLEAAADAAAGTASATLTGTATGVDDETVTVSVTVEEAATGSFTLEIGTDTLTIQQGQSGSADVTITRTAPFAGTVDLEVIGAPTGLTATLDSTTVGGEAAVIEVTAAADLAPDTYELELTGTGEGVSEQTDTLFVTVTEGAGTGVSLEFCDVLGTPDWVAVQDGDGAWTQVEASGEGAYDFDLTEGRGGVAWAIEEGGFADVQVIYGTPAEIPGFVSEVCEDLDGTKTVTGDVTGLGDAEQANVTLGQSSALVLAGGDGSFTLEGVQEGPQDLVASRVQVEDETPLVDRLIIRRDLEPADGSALETLDFEGEEAFEPVPLTATIENLGDDQASVLSGYFTGNGLAGNFFFGMPSTEAGQTFYGIPEDQQADEDLHFLGVVAADDFEDPTEQRLVISLFHAPGDVTLTLGPELGTVGVSAAETDPYVRPQVVYEVQAEYDSYWTAEFDQATNSATLSVTEGWLDGTTLDVTFPDFTGTEGWNDAWGLEAGAETDWLFEAFGWEGESGVTEPTFEEGALFHGAIRSGTFTP